MTNLFLGVIAVSVLVMAVIQVAAIVFAVSAAKRLGEAAERLERDLKPVVRNLEIIAADAARASTVTVAQMERAARLFSDVGRRAESVLGALPAFLGPAGRGVAFVGGLRAVLAAIRGLRRTRSSRKRSAQGGDDDALFIG